MADYIVVSRQLGKQHKSDHECDIGLNQCLPSVTIGSEGSSSMRQASNSSRQSRPESASVKKTDADWVNRIDASDSSADAHQRFTRIDFLGQLSSPSSDLNADDIDWMSFS